MTRIRKSEAGLNGGEDDNVAGWVRLGAEAKGCNVAASTVDHEDTNWLVHVSFETDTGLVEDDGLLAMLAVAVGSVWGS